TGTTCSITMCSTRTRSCNSRLCPIFHSRSNRTKMKRYSELLVILVLTAITAWGCNDTFEPLQENEEYVFSMYGTLDVHADTQWVRVMPIGDRLFNNNPEPSGTVVTLTRLSTGDVITMNDSLFTFGGPSYIWNYWTTEPLQPGEPYTVTATAAD